MARIRIKTDEVGCRKPGCKRKLSRPVRHHRAMQSLFINAYRKAGKRKTGSEMYRKLQQRYNEFRDEDCVLLCEHHHCEIHLRYDQIILDDQADRGRPLRKYTWPQAKSLMKKLEAECLDWEQETTPGVDPQECADLTKRFPWKAKRRRKKGGKKQR